LSSADEALKSAQRQLARRLVGSSRAIDAIRRLIAQVAPAEASVLILGESGTGKEVVARGIHDLSARAGGPFVPVNCGAIPGELLESELFGHEKGAFTGAINARKGRFEMAAGGTLFLDEIGDMPLQMQVKLLRVLQERCFERVGSNRSQPCDVRVIAATHQDLEARVEAGEFRMDLFYRLNVFPIDVPPLRERVEDVPALVRRFVTAMESEGRGSVAIAGDAMECLMRYRWPGNVRELSNLVERLAILHPDAPVTAEQLPRRFVPADAAARGAAADSGTSPPRGVMADPDDDVRRAIEAIARAEAQADGAAEPAIPDARRGADPIRVDFAFEEEGAPAEAEAREPAAADRAAAGEAGADPAIAALENGGLDLRSHLADLERSLMIHALEQTDWVVAKAAKLLNLQRTTLVEKMRKYDIQRPGGATED
jgi:sigma-54 specific flagellar transcriptional regulator A